MTLPPSSEVGALGVRHLKRLWADKMAAREGRGTSPARREEWDLDQIVLCGLNLALEETSQFLMQTAPAFEEFERWVLQKNDGSLDPRQVARLNAAIASEPHIPAGDDGTAPVLSAADRARWDEHGYVIVREAISRAQAAATARALWDHQRMDPADPETWYVQKTHGIMVQLFHGPALAANRRAARVRRAFEELWGTDDLWITVDRVSFNPPERDGWRFPGPHLHWDAAFDERPFPFATQGLLYLTDTPAHQGAFACVPGFHRRIDAWLAGLPPGADPQKEDLLALGPQPITANAGDLIIWHHALPHGATRNTGTQPRMVHYINALPTPRRSRPSAGAV